jgi:cell wall assembly regulator SMI1
MSELTSALERINNWYQEKESRSVFQAGLSRSAIDELAKDLQFSLPEEVYELYQWCNGSSEVPIAFMQQYMLPLRDAVNWRQDVCGLNYGEDWMEDDPTWFPVFRLWCDHAFYVVVLGDQEGKSVVRNYDPEVKGYQVYYESLTDLLLHSAEWLESAEYHGSIDGWQVKGEIDTKLRIKYRVQDAIN